MVHKILFWAGFGRSPSPFPENTCYITLFMYPHRAAALLTRANPNIPVCLPPLTSLPGVATRIFQLSIEMRPFFQQGGLWVYPFFAGIGGSFGYWLQGVEHRQKMLLQQRKELVTEKRRRRDEREARLLEEEAGSGNGGMLGTAGS